MKTSEKFFFAPKHILIRIFICLYKHFDVYVVITVNTFQPPSKERYMSKSRGTIDRIVRVILALGIPGLYLAHIVSGTAAIMLGILAVILILTSLAGFCPLYLPLHLSTRKK